MFFLLKEKLYLSVTWPKKILALMQNHPNITSLSLSWSPSTSLSMSHVTSLDVTNSSSTFLQTRRTAGDWPADYKHSWHSTVISSQTVQCTHAQFSVQWTVVQCLSCHSDLLLVFWCLVCCDIGGLWPWVIPCELTIQIPSVSFLSLTLTTNTIFQQKQQIWLIFV